MSEYVLIAILVCISAVVLGCFGYYLHALKVQIDALRYSLHPSNAVRDEQVATANTLLNKLTQTAYMHTSDIEQVQEAIHLLAQKLDVYAQSQAHNQGSINSVVSSIQTQVGEMNALMINKKARGSWGEFQLEVLLLNMLGEHSRIVQRQVTLQNNTRVDIALSLPNSHRVLPIDSKFPLENYNKWQEAKAQGNTLEEQRCKKAFIADVKKHIGDIEKKYVTPVDTLDEAIMFIPSEAIYFAICADCTELFEYALKQRVLICSPTTILGVIQIIMSATKEYELHKHIDDVIDALNNTLQDTVRLQKATDALSKNIAKLAQECASVERQSNKIIRDIEKLNTITQSTS